MKDFIDCMKAITLIIICSPLLIITALVDWIVD